MKALVLTDVKKVEVLDVATPEIKANEVLVKTAFAGICGTDHALYAGLPGSADAVPPIVLGHENSGVVTKIGKDVTNLSVGDRVAVDPNIYCGQCEFCRTDRPQLCEHLSAVGVTRDGGFEEYFTAPASVVYAIPDDVSLEEAAVIEPISCAVHGMKLLKVSPYQKALVIGDGFMGQLFTQLLQAYGIHQVDLAGIVDEKLKVNHDKFGVKNTFNTAKGEVVPANEYNVVIEAVGNPKTQELAIESAAKGGQVLMFGVGGPDAKFEMNTYDIFKKELTVQGSFINPYAFEDSIALLSSKQLDVKTLISHELEVSQVKDFLDGKITGVSKAVVRLGGEEA